MSSSQNDNFARNDIIHALAFAAYLYTRIADGTREYSLAVSRYATEIASARTTIAAELANSRDVRLTFDYEDTPDATGEDLINQAQSVDTAIRKALKNANASAYKTITEGMFVAADRLKGMLDEVSENANAWQCCVCQRLFTEKQEECPCGASYAAFKPVWKGENGKWFGCC